MTKTISSSAQLTFLWKEKKFFQFPCCSTREELSIDASIITVFTGVQTDTILESSYGKISAYKNFRLNAQK